MKSAVHRALIYFPMGGLILISGILLCLWGPESGLLQDAYRAESERLFQAFSVPLAKAAAQGDDLARVDELRRIQKLPGVALARVNENTVPAQYENALVWEGKTVGSLEIRLRKTRWRLWRYRWLERAFSLMILFILASGVLGYFWERRQDQLRRKVIGMLERQRARLDKRHDVDRHAAEVEHRRWLGQSMEWAAKGLLVLDGSQRLVMANAAALDVFRLTPQAFGSHWLDHAASPEWAAALCQSVEHPEMHVPGPICGHSASVSLITFSNPEDPHPESTWIVIS